MKPHHDACLGLTFFVRDRLFVIGIAEQSEDRAIHPRTRLDHVRNKTLLRLFVEIVEGLPARLLMLLQVVIGPIRHPFQLLPAEGKVVFYVVGALRIKGAIGVRHRQDVQLLARDTDVLVKSDPLVLPVLE